MKFSGGTGVQPVFDLPTLRGGRSKKCRALDATARSVTWRGAYQEDNTPIFPTLFNLSIYANTGGLPGAVLSSTDVFVTGVDTDFDAFGDDVYEFQADITPVALTPPRPIGFRQWRTPPPMPAITGAGRPETT